MAWIKLDDSFSEHPKVEQAGDLAAWLYVCGLQYSSRVLSDGFIPTGKVARLTGLKRPLELAARLVDVGLWHRVDQGFRIHEYEKYQRTSQQVQEQRDRASKRVAKHRAGR